MGNKKIYVNGNQLSVIKESEFNYHLGNGHDLSPYKSDNKFQMIGRDTGHFGSGTYFSTYNGKYSNEVNNNDKDFPNFIQIKDGVYRVDFGLYKNLYRVYSRKHGDALYTLLKNLNMLYNKICNDFGKFRVSSANYSNSLNYQIIKKNSESLGLRCPSYYELIRLVQEHGKNDNAIQSFSTLFMELNGYNGVNVSGIDYYDSTLHGSVIYDLSKVSDEIKPINIKSLFSGINNDSYSNTILGDGYDDVISDSLRGISFSWCDKLNDYPLVFSLRLLKNYTASGNVLEFYQINRLNNDLKKRYLRLLFSKCVVGRYGNPLDNLIYGNDSNRFMGLIDELGCYYWVNYGSNDDSKSILISLLNNFCWKIPFDADISTENKMKQSYLDKLLSYLSRDLSSYEEKWIKEEYFDVE